MRLSTPWFTVFAGLAALATWLPAQSSITTLFSGNLSFGGQGSANLFDVQVNTGIVISQLDVNVGETAGAVGSLDVYTTPGTHVGNERNSAAWTLVGTAPVTAGGSRTPSIGTLATPFPLTPGSYGMALCYRGLTPLFTHRSAPATYSSADLTLTLGTAVNSCFGGSTLSNCVWNGGQSTMPSAVVSLM